MFTKLPLCLYTRWFDNPTISTGLIWALGLFNSGPSQGQKVRPGGNANRWKLLWLDDTLNMTYQLYHQGTLQIMHSNILKIRDQRAWAAEKKYHGTEVILVILFFQAVERPTHTTWAPKMAMILLNLNTFEQTMSKVGCLALGRDKPIAVHYMPPPRSKPLAWVRCLICCRSTFRHMPGDI